MAKLGDVCEKKIDTIKSNYKGTIDYIDIASVDNQKKIITSTKQMAIEDAPSRAKQLVLPGDILVSMVRPNLNAVALVTKTSNNALVASTGYCVLRCLPNVDTKYVFYFCQSSAFVDELVRQATGASYPAVTANIVRDCFIPLPALDEQRHIAAILDKVTDLIAKRHAQLDKLDLLVKSRFVEMFDQCDCYEFLGDANIYISDGNYSSKYPTADEFVDNGVPFIRASNMVGNTISDTEMYYISPQKHEELLKGHLKPYDVLIATRGAIGKIAVVPERHNDSNINAQIVLLRCNRDNYNPIYLSYYLQLPSTQMKIHSLTSGSAQPQLPIKRLVQLELLKPPIVRQNEFSNFAEYLRSLSFYIQQSIDKLDTLKKVLMQQYFGGN